MLTINSTQLQDNLENYLERVSNGEKFMVSCDGGYNLVLLSENEYKQILTKIGEKM